MSNDTADWTPPAPTPLKAVAIVTGQTTLIAGGDYTLLNAVGGQQYKIFEMRFQLYSAVVQNFMTMRDNALNVYWGFSLNSQIMQTVNFLGAKWPALDAIQLHNWDVNPVTFFYVLQYTQAPSF